MITQDHLVPEGYSVPGPQARPLVGNLKEITADQCIYKSLSRLADEWGPLFKLKIPGQNWVVISDAALARELLIKNQSKLAKGKTLKELTHMTRGLQTITEMDGERWRHFRAGMFPFFGGNKFLKRSDRLDSVCEEAAEALARTGRVNALDYMNRLAFRSISELLFSFSPDCLSRPEERCRYIDNQDYLIDQLMIRMQRTPLWRHLPIPSNFQVKRRVQQNRDELAEFLEGRIKNPATQREDYLDDLLALRDPEGRPLSEDQILALTYGIIGAGYESTGAVLHWALYELAKNEELQGRVRDEIAGSYINFENVGEFSLLNAFVAEALRYYPPFPIIIREVAENIDMKFPIKAGTVVFVLVGQVQRDKAVWGPTAEHFDPRRFLRQPMTNQQKAAYFPFGLGRRFCLGENLAKVEIPYLLARLLQKIKVTRLTESPPVSRLKFVNVSTCGVSLEVERV